MNAYILATLFVAHLFCDPVRSDCSTAEYQKCTKLADPLIKRVDLIFPDNMKDIEMVCNTWNSFVDCLNKYTGMCFTEDQRRTFKRAIEKAIGSVHKMCTETVYQKEYLSHATCMKNTVVKGGRCVHYYRILLDEVEQQELSSTALCCSHDRFKQCVLSETKWRCDNGVNDGAAARLSGEFIRNAFSSMEEICTNYIPQSGDCPLPTESIQISSSPSESYPRSFTPIHDQNAKELPSFEISLPTAPASVTTWLPSPAPTDSRDTLISNVQLTSSQTSGTWEKRGRPASFGRASSWSNPDVTQPLQSFTTVQTTDEVSVVKKVGPTDGPTTWYPAAGSQLSNEVDEPNQLGLYKPEQSGVSTNSINLGLMLLVIVLLT